MENNWTEEELLHGINERNMAAFEKFYHRIIKPLRDYIYNIVDNMAEAEDLASEAFIKTWEINPTFESLKHAENYIYSAARNNSISFLKSPYRMKRSSLPDELPETIDNYREGVVNRAPVFPELNELITKLPPSPKKDVLLLILDNKKTSEIAQILQKSKKYVLNTKLAGIKFLKKLFNTDT